MWLDKRWGCVAHGHGGPGVSPLMLLSSPDGVATTMGTLMSGRRRLDLASFAARRWGRMRERVYVDA